jgi:hypothetical protein
MSFILVKYNKIKERDGLGKWHEWGRTYWVLLGKTEGKRSLGRTWCW